MIDKKDLYNIGMFGKPHGIKGEVTLIADGKQPDLNNDSHIICEIDGIPVPFFIESFRSGKTGSAFVKFENINSEQDAKIFTGKTAYLHASPVKESEKPKESTFIGYQVIDKNLSLKGVITDMDTSTKNVLLKVACSEKDYIIPFGFSQYIDYMDRIIYVKLPEGFMDI
jgi:16S rRNA processing protein RimM